MQLRWGARGYCATSLVRMFRRLGLPKTATNKAVKILGMLSTQCSFFIWLNRDKAKWPNPDLNSVIRPKNLSSVDVSSTPVVPPLSSSTPLSDSRAIPRKTPVPKVGFRNLGNSCYASALLQVFSVLPRLWSQVPSESSKTSPIPRSIAILMCLLKRRKRRVLDPSSFLWALKRKMPSFKFHQQYDAHEVLMTVLNSVLAPTSISQDLVGCKIKISTTCKSCFHSFDSEDSSLILSTPVCNSVKESLRQHLAEESIGGLCAVCDSSEGFDRESAVVSCGNILILHLKRFDNNLNKISTRVSCLPDSLEVPIRSPNESIGNISLPINCESFLQQSSDCVLPSIILGLCLLVIIGVT